jgi:hypothetical protein
MSSTTNKQEIWSNGLRNPWKWSFDRIFGDMWIGDVGQNAWEEVDYEPLGTPVAEIMAGDAMREMLNSWCKPNRLPYF